MKRAPEVKIQGQDKGVRLRACLAWRHAGLLALALALFVWPATLKAKDITVVQADGTALKTKEVKDVKGAAIDQALKNAVADALETIIENEALEVDPSLVETNIYANAVNFVVNFKILSEERLTEEKEVWPDKEPEEKTPQSDIKPVVPTKKPPNAEKPEIVTVESYHIWLEARIDTVLLKDASGKIVLSREGSPPVVSIVVLDITDFETYNSIKEALKRVTMIKDIAYDSFYPGRFVFSARTTAGSKALVARIAKETGGEFIVTKGAKGTIIIKAYPTAFSIE